MPYDPNSLYDLLPAIYRERDAQLNYPLRALLNLIGQQAALIDGDIQQLYNNLFIETCAPWVIPYIGDLVSNNLLFDASRTRTADTAATLFPDLAGKDLRPAVAARVRADVAKTVYYRRRKATPTMLEELAGDVMGWPVHVVEFFQRLGWTQNLEHLRYGRQWTDVRSLDRLDRVEGAFDETSHTVDVHRIGQQEGWYNLRNSGFFVWRVRSYPLSRVPARQASQPWQYHFSPLGNPAPLFTRLRSGTRGKKLVTELNISAPIRKMLFYNDLQAYRNTPPPRPDFTELYGSFEPLPNEPTVSSDTSLFVVLNGVAVDPAQDPNAPISTFMLQIKCGLLNPWPLTQPSGKIVVIDVENGRLAVGDGWGATGPVDVFFHYGFSADLGGGPYDRRKWLLRSDLVPPPQRYRVQENGVAPVFGSLTAALSQWQTDQRPNAVITILDSRNYQLPASIVLSNDRWLVIEAADRERPLLQTQTTGLEVDVSPPTAGDLDRNGSLTLSGVLIEGFVHVVGDLGQLRILHSTLVPGRQLNEDGNPQSTEASLIIEGLNSNGQKINTLLKVQVAYSILGGLRGPQEIEGVWILDSIVDGVGEAALSNGAGDKGPPLTTERSTFFGTVLVKSLEASEVIFDAKVDALRTQQGCVRFSYVPPDSHTPRRFHCQPDLEVAQEITQAEQRNPTLSATEQDEIRKLVQAWLVPSFKARNYGSPYYAQLQLGCPVQIRTGAEDGSEMGAFSHLKQPQRESNLTIRLEEYLPFGLEAGIIYVT